MDSNALKRLIDPLKRKILLGISRAIVKAVDDEKKVQRMQVGLLDDEVRDSLERFQEYGFTSVPHDESEAVCVFPGGSRSHGIVIAVEDRRYRLKGLTKGEVAIYTDEGDKIHLKRGHQIEVQTSTLTVNADAAVNVNTPKATFSADVEIKGKLDVVGDITSKAEITDKDGSMSETRETFNEHDHNENGDGGGVTNPPNQQMP